ncbi:hypothetical protein [Paenibacillus harenae]|uniref:hypothetical protein n=1 Tax=Paenibacillus harenae TaxID=306543 RepID=UPI0040391035
MKAWCSANHCSVEQLKYWLYKIKRVSSSATPDPKTSAFAGCWMVFHSASGKPIPRFMPLPSFRHIFVIISS